MTKEIKMKRDDREALTIEEVRARYGLELNFGKKGVTLKPVIDSVPTTEPVVEVISHSPTPKKRFRDIRPPADHVKYYPILMIGLIILYLLK